MSELSQHGIKPGATYWNNATTATTTRIAKTITAVKNHRSSNLSGGGIVDPQDHGLDLIVEACGTARK